MLNKLEPENLQDVLNQLISKLGWQEKSDLVNIIKQWDEIVGEKFSEVSVPHKLNEGSLTINVESSVWRSELFYRREQIIQKINDINSRIIVKELIIR
jgi:predicted nucleic acid-binding Zn ribbon protein